MNDDETTTANIEKWNAELSNALQIPPADVEAILSLTGVVAHSVVRPAGPIAAYLVGYAVAAAGDARSPADALADSVRVARELLLRETERPK